MTLLSVINNASHGVQYYSLLMPSSCSNKLFEVICEPPKSALNKISRLRMRSVTLSRISIENNFPDGFKPVVFVQTSYSPFFKLHCIKFVCVLIQRLSEQRGRPVYSEVGRDLWRVIVLFTILTGSKRDAWEGTSGNSKWNTCRPLLARWKRFGRKRSFLK